jgi:hypothetical protein
MQRRAFAGPLAELALLQDVQRPADVKRLDPEWGMNLSMVEDTAYPPFLRASVIKELQQSFRTKPGDVFVCTYAKCGTTWMQTIVLLLLHDGDTGKVWAHPRLQQQAPWLEACYLRYVRWGGPCPYLDDRRIERDFAPMHHVDTQGRARRVFKTHATFGLFPVAPERRAKDTKIIVVARNPKDCAASMYAHAKAIPPFGYSGPWSHFFELFMSGQVEEGRWDTYHAEWYRAMQANPDEVLFVHFEALKRDAASEIRKIARFIGVEPTPALVEKVVAGSSFSAMKKASAASGIKTAVATSRFRKVWLYAVREE